MARLGAGCLRDAGRRCTVSSFAARSGVGSPTATCRSSWASGSDLPQQVSELSWDESAGGVKHTNRPVVAPWAGPGPNVLSRDETIARKPERPARRVGRRKKRYQWRTLGRFRQRRQRSLLRRGCPPPRLRHLPLRHRSRHPWYRRCFRPAGRPPPRQAQHTLPHAPLAPRRVQRARRCGFGSSWCSRPPWLWRSCCTACMCPLRASSGAVADSFGRHQTTSAGS